MPTNVVVIAPDQAGSNISVDFTQKLHLFFADDATFCCDNLGAFHPPLPNGQSFTGGSFWGPTKAANGHAGEDVHWDTDAYGGNCVNNASVVYDVSLNDTSPQVAAKAPVATPLVTHVIHIGPGSVTVPLTEFLTENRAASSAVLKDWKATEHLLEIINRNAAKLEPSIGIVLKLILDSGREAYRILRTEHRHDQE